jgi:hypothetical protein
MVNLKAILLFLWTINSGTALVVGWVLLMQRLGLAMGWIR